MRGWAIAASLSAALILVSALNVARADDRLVGVWQGSDDSAGTLQGVEPNSWERLVFYDTGELRMYAGPIFMGSYQYTANSDKILIPEVDWKLSYNVTGDVLKIDLRTQGDLIYERLTEDELDEFVRSANVKP